MIVDNIEKKVIAEDFTVFEIWKYSYKDATLVFSYKYEAEYALSIQVWHEYLEEDKIISIHKTIAQHVSAHKQFILTSISDISRVEGSFHLANEWVVEKFMSKAVSFGYRYAFFVKPKDLVAELALEDALERLEKIEGLREVKIFEDFASAYQYAKSVIKSNFNER